MTTVEEMCADVQKYGCSELVVWLCFNSITAEQAKVIGECMNAASDNDLRGLWRGLQKNTKNLILVHPLVEKEMIRRWP